MHYFFLFMFITASGKTLYADAPAQINTRPIYSYATCVKEARKIEERMRPAVENCELFQGVQVICAKHIKKGGR